LDLLARVCLCLFDILDDWTFNLESVGKEKKKRREISLTCFTECGKLATRALPSLVDEPDVARCFDERPDKLFCLGGGNGGFR
jgi:hypothetical protein